MVADGRDPRIDFFDSCADDWDLMHNVDDIIVFLDRADRLYNIFSKGMNVLEVGAGTGNITSWIVERVRPGRVVAIDFSPKMIEIASSKGIDAEFICSDICKEEGLPSHMLYDLAFCFHSFPHFRDKVGALNNINRLLRLSANLVVLHLKDAHTINEFHSSLDGPVSKDYLPESKEEWQELLELSSFRMRDFVNDGIFFLRAEKI